MTTDRIAVLPLVLAGGSGTRLWPLSREEYPKQLLRLAGSNSLLQETLARVHGLEEVSVRHDGAPLVTVTAPAIVCHQEQRFLTLEQATEGDGAASRTGAILLEPASRNTAPALTSGALLATRDGADPVLVVMPADHVIDDIDAFHRAVLSAVHLAATGMILTLGVVPDRPETGYGYIRKGAGVKAGPDHRGFAIDGFVEKPGADAARSYVASGKYLWNSGIFVIRASVWIEAIDRHRPKILAACRGAATKAREDGPFVWLDGDAYEACPSDSIDYAVMERLAKSHLRPADDGREGEAIPAAVVPLDAGWSDIGSWQAVHEHDAGAGDGNALQGDVFATGTRRSLIHAEHRFVAAVGLEDTVVVETADAVLVADRRRTQEVRDVVAWLRGEGRSEGRAHRRVYRPWGSFEQLGLGERYQVKRLSLNPGAAISLQLHHHRAEHWVVVRGTARVTRGDDVFFLTENESTFIPVGTRHRLENPGSVPLEVIEVQSGSYLGEDDIVRFEDRYNR